MKGFIEVQIITHNKECFITQNKTNLINVNDIIRILSYKDGSVIYTKELVSRYECSSDNLEIKVVESYEEIKELIKKAQ